MKKIIIIALVSLFLIGIRPGYAAGEKSSLLMLPTTSKEIFLLYHKMNDINLNTQDVLQKTDAYKNGSPAVQADILSAKNKSLLETQFAEIDPDRQVIVIRSAVRIETQMTPSRFSVSIAGMDKRPVASIYFPYNWAGMNIALIPDKLDPFLEVPVKAPELTAINSKIQNGAATMVIEMLPLKADPSPMMLDDIEQRLLMTKIVSVAYYNQSMQSIWQWQAGDYRRPGAPSPLSDLKR